MIAHRFGNVSCHVHILLATLHDVHLCRYVTCICHDGRSIIWVKYLFPNCSSLCFHPSHQQGKIHIHILIPLLHTADHLLVSFLPFIHRLSLSLRSFLRCVLSLELEMEWLLCPMIPGILKTQFYLTPSLSLSYTLYIYTQHTHHTINRLARLHSLSLIPVSRLSAHEYAWSGWPFWDTLYDAQLRHTDDIDYQLTYKIHLA